MNRHRTQDPKYDIEETNGAIRLVNAATGIPIPYDEPILIMRAQDIKAVQHIWNYASTCENLAHRRIVEARAMAFEIFAMDYPERMKEPDTVLP